jgi:hypothetical protein
LQKAAKIVLLKTAAFGLQRLASGKGIPNGKPGCTPWQDQQYG